MTLRQLIQAIHEGAMEGRDYPLASLTRGMLDDGPDLDENLKGFFLVGNQGTCYSTMDLQALTDLIEQELPTAQLIEVKEVIQ